MYNKEFFSRINIQQICNFFATGTELVEYQEGTPEERLTKYTKSHLSSLREFRDKVLSFDWDSISDSHEKDMKAEELWQKVILNSGNLNDLSFEMGFVAGILFSKDLINIIPES